MARVEEKADFYLLTVVTKGKKGSLLNCVLPMAIFINELMGISLTCWHLHDGIEQTELKGTYAWEACCSHNQKILKVNIFNSSLCCNQANTKVWV